VSVSSSVEAAMTGYTRTSSHPADAMATSDEVPPPLLKEANRRSEVMVNDMLAQGNASRSSCSRGWKKFSGEAVMAASTSGA